MNGVDYDNQIRHDETISQDVYDELRPLVEKLYDGVLEWMQTPQGGFPLDEALKYSHVDIFVEEYGRICINLCAEISVDGLTDMCIGTLTPIAEKEDPELWCDVVGGGIVNCVIEPNTKITYMYRDADNYKEYHQVVVSGGPDSHLIRRIVASLHEGEFFSPDELGWDWGMIGYDSNNETDHPFCEICADDFMATLDEPTVKMTVDQVADKFVQAGIKGWENTDGYKGRINDIFGWNEF